MNTRLTRALATLTFVIGGLCGLVFIGQGLTHPLHGGAVCVKTDFMANGALEDGLPIAQGVEATSSATRLCKESPSTGQVAADLGADLPWPLFGFLALLLFSRVLDAVVLQGPFTEVMARRLTVLGWFVAVGTPVAGLVVGWSQSWLVGSMAPVAGSGPMVSGPLVLVFAGLAAVIMGKIMGDGVRMREDLEGTI